MWIALLKFVTSSGHKVLWDNISEASGSPTSSIFSFYVICSIFKDLLRGNCLVLGSVDPTCSSITTPPQLSTDEENALQYIGGYIIRALKKQLLKGKESSVMVASLHSFLEDTEVSDEFEENMPDFKDWINAIDRGGLYYCKATFFLRGFAFTAQWLEKHK